MTRRLVPALSLVLLCACGSEPTSMQDVAASCTAQGQMSCPRPIFNVASLKASQRYYKDALGFSLDWDYGDPPSFGSVTRDEATLFMCEGCQGTPGAWVMVFAPDVDTLHEEFVDRGAKIRMAPTTMPWGIREMHVSDLDGNVIRFGHAVDGAE